MLNTGVQRPLRFISAYSLVFLVVGALFVGWLLNTPHGLLGKADAIGYAVCHQIDLRSFHLGERRLPLCARCSGMYLGAMLGLLYQTIIGPRRGGMPSWQVSLVLGLLVMGFAGDGLNSYLHLFPGAPGLYEPQNWLRLLTGSGMGMVIAIVLYPSFNQTIWKNWDPRQAVGNWKSLGGLFILTLLLDTVVLIENPLILYPLALISAAGVFVILSMVYSMILVITFKSENCFQSLSHLILPLTSGFGIGLLQIVLIDLLRFWLTGSWDGFHFG
jgi:uncharacterized membrane protein